MENEEKSSKGAFGRFLRIAARAGWDTDELKSILGFIVLVIAEIAFALLAQKYDWLPTSYSAVKWLTYPLPIVALAYGGSVAVTRYRKLCKARDRDAADLQRGRYRVRAEYWAGVALLSAGLALAGSLTKFDERYIRPLDADLQSYVRNIVRLALAECTMDLPLCTRIRDSSETLTHAIAHPNLAPGFTRHAFEEFDHVIRDSKPLLQSHSRNAVDRMLDELDVWLPSRIWIEMLSIVTYLLIMFAAGNAVGLKVATAHFEMKLRDKEFLPRIESKPKTGEWSDSGPE